MRLGRRRTMAIVVAAAMLGACTPGKPDFSAVLPAVPGDIDVDAQPVDLYDETGLVTAFEVPDEEPREGPDPVVRLTNAGFTVHWWGGACESRTRITFGRDDVRFRVSIEHDTDLTSLVGCPGLGIPRGVHIHTRFPMDLDLLDAVVVG